MSTETFDLPVLAAARTGALGDTLLLRINPVAGRRLGSPELTDVLRRIVTAQEHKGLLREPACDALYTLAGQLTGKHRHQALALKRAIYNDRDPGAAGGAYTWPDVVDAWLASDRDVRRADADIRAGHRGFLAAERLMLAEAIGDESLQLGLALNAPQALDAIQRYRRRASALPAHERKSERGIIQYLTRAMVRTSPLSWLTAVGFAVWSPTGVQLDTPTFDCDKAQSFVTVDRVLFGASIAGMVTPPVDIATAVVVPNPTLRMVDGGVRFQRRIDGAIHLVETPLTAQLRILLEVTGLGPLPAPVLSEQLAVRLGIDLAGGARVAAAAAAVQILVAGPVIDEQAADPLPLARALLGADHPGAALIAAVQREVVEVAGGSVAQRRAALTRLEAIQDRVNDLTTRPARLHLNEDVMVPTTTVTDRGYQAALHDLAGVVELASIFDSNHVMRCLLTTAFTERFGTGGNANLVDCGEGLAREVAERARRLTPARGDERESAAGAVANLLAMRERARAAITAEIELGGDDEELWLPAGTFGALAETLPERLRRRPASYGLLVQPIDGRLVVNGCYGGHNLLGMRFLGAAAAIGPPPDNVDGAGTVHSRVNRRVRRLFADDGVRLVEDYGLHDSNVNHRVQLLPEVIDPAGWLGVRLVHDTDLDELALTLADGTPIRAVYLGMRWIETLPPPLRIAMWLADTSQVAFDPIGWARRAAMRTRVSGPESTTSRYPRVVAGTVVVGRRRWYPGTDFPRQPTGPDDAGHLLAMTRWRAAHGVPPEIVIKTMPEPASDIDPAAALAWYQRVHRRSKPQYVDLTSALMVRVLPRLLERRGAGFIEEAMPGVRDGRHAFEWVVEYDRAAGGRFAAGRTLSPPEQRVEESR